MHMFLSDLLLRQYYALRFGLITCKLIYVFKTGYIPSFYYNPPHINKTSIMEPHARPAVAEPT